MTTDFTPIGLNGQLDTILRQALDLGRQRALRSSTSDIPLYDILAYHLGFLNQRFESERTDVGKRIRPMLCTLACHASGGDPDLAIHAAAAIELVHNFTLLHDDIQDQSPLRRHRPTVWSVWGVPQAINAGDAMFALAHLALNRLSEAGADPATVLSLSTGLHQTTLRIVEGQVLDLSFEDRADVTASEYLTMISGKTAAICEFACRAGAVIAGASDDTISAVAEVGFALGIGFQLRDDLLGVWGATSETGKAAADDIRRRKKALPLLVLLERASASDRAHVLEILEHDDLSSTQIDEVLRLMTLYEVQEAVQNEVGTWHRRALDRLEATSLLEPARSALFDLVRGLESRAG